MTATCLCFSSPSHGHGDLPFPLLVSATQPFEVAERYRLVEQFMAQARVLARVVAYRPIMREGSSSRSRRGLPGTSPEQCGPRNPSSPRERGRLSGAEGPCPLLSGATRAGHCQGAWEAILLPAVFGDEIRRGTPDTDAARAAQVRLDNGYIGSFPQPSDQVVSDSPLRVAPSSLSSTSWESPPRLSSCREGRLPVSLDGRLDQTRSANRQLPGLIQRVSRSYRVGGSRHVAFHRPFPWRSHVTRRVHSIRAPRRRCLPPVYF